MNKKTIYGLVFLVILLVIGFFWEEGDGPTNKKLKKIKNADKIILNVFAEEIAFLYDEEKWFVGEKKFKINSSQFDELEKLALGKLNLELISSKKDSHLKFEVDKTDAIFVKTFKGDKLLRHLIIGKQSSSYSHNYIREKGSDNVYLTSGNLKAEFESDNFSTYVDKSILSFVQNELVSITLTDDKGKSELLTQNEVEKSSNETMMVWQNLIGEKFKESEMNDLVNSLSSLSCDSFLFDETLNEQEENFVRKINIKTVKDSIDLIIIKKTENERWKCRSSSFDKAYFTLDNTIAERLLISFKDLKE